MFVSVFCLCIIFVAIVCYLRNQMNYRQKGGLSEFYQVVVEFFVSVKDWVSLYFEVLSSIDRSTFISVFLQYVTICFIVNIIFSFLLNVVCFVILLIKELFLYVI